MVIQLDLIKINNIVKKLIVIFFVIIGSTVYSANIVVNNIYLNGLNRISLDTILSNLPFKNGDVINDDVIADSIRVLFSTKYFENIEISGDDTGIITIQVKECPIINNITYYGNKTIKEDMIQKILDVKQVQSGRSLNKYSIFEVEHNLKNMCYSLGKFHATVEIVIIPLSRNRVDLKVMITEGKTAKIKQINIIGNHVFHTKKLLSQFTLYNKIKWWNILSNKQYETQKFFNDLETLRNFYLNRGYAMFGIDSTKISFTPDEMNLDIYVYVTEGARYLFSSIKFHGDIFNILPDIKNCINIDPGELYSSNKVKEIKNNIQYMLGKYGYVQPSILIESDINETTKVIKLHVYVDAGNRYYVHEIYFEGNNITKDSVIRREINQMENAQLNYVNILTDQKRLKNIGYFKSINAYIKYLPNMLNQVDVIYQVEECNTGNLTLSVGVGTESGINIQFGLCQENFLGTGNSISITNIKNQYQTYAEISATQFYYKIFKMSVEEKIFYNNMNTNYTDLSDYNLKNYGINFNCTYPFIQYHVFNIGLNYMSNYLSKIVPQVAIWRYLHSMHIYPELFVNKCFRDDINFYANDCILVLGWTFNNLNHLYFPTTGSYFNVTNKLTLPGSKNQYYKITVSGNYYLSLDQYSDWILMTSIHAGYAGSIHVKESPFYDNFYAGGINTIRGFRLNSIGPKAAYYLCDKQCKIIHCITCSVENSQDSIGGNAIGLVKTELIIPFLYFNQKYSDIARISIFVDAGTLWDTFWKNTEITRAAGITDYSIPNNIRISSGISLKWISPIGPVVFSYSKLIKKYSGDIEEPFQFSIGKTW